jgi:hypothetical protein
MLDDPHGFGHILAQIGVSLGIGETQLYRLSFRGNVEPRNRGEIGFCFTEHRTDRDGRKRSSQNNGQGRGQNADRLPKKCATPLLLGSRGCFG